MSAVSHTMLWTPARFMNDSRFAISCSRRSGGPSPSRNGVLADQADRHVAGDHFPGRVGGHQLALQPGQLRRTKDAGVAAVVALVEGGIAVAAHVDHEDVEQRSI